MGRFALLALMLLPFGACGGPAARPSAAIAEPDTAESADQRACREEARNSPAIRRLGAQWIPNNLANERRIAAEEQAIFSRLYRECLRLRGLPVSGGVERPVIR